MKLDLEIWKKYYGESNQISKLLKKLTSNRKACRSYDDYVYLIEQSKNIAKSTSRYLDACGLKMPEPRWHYNYEDPKTHASNDDFKYQDRMKVDEWDMCL